MTLLMISISSVREEVVVIQPVQQAISIVAGDANIAICHFQVSRNNLIAPAVTKSFIRVGHGHRA